MTIQVFQLSNVIDLAMLKDSKFLHIDGIVHQYYNFSIFLLIPTRMPSDCWVIVLARFEFETANQPGFEPRSPRPKAAMLTIELHSIEFVHFYKKFEVKKIRLVLDGFQDCCEDWF